MLKFEMTFDRDCKSFMEACVKVALWTKDDLEFTFPGRDNKFVNLSSKYVRDNENGWAGCYEVTIDTGSDITHFRYEYIDE